MYWLRIWVVSCLLLIVACDQDVELDVIEIEPHVVQPDVLVSTDDLLNGASDFDRANHPGNALYKDNCEICHDGVVPKAPQFSWLEMMSPAVIHHSISEGVMKVQAEKLSDLERLQITEYLTRQTLDGVEAVAAKMPPMCSDTTLDISKPIPVVGWGHDTNRYSPSTVAELSVDDIPSLKLKWAFAFPDSFRARSQPSIAMGAVFVGSQDGRVYSFDLETGCTKWVFAAAAEVRTGIVISVSEESPTEDSPPLAFFGDIVAKFYAVNALTGELVWSRKADDHPSATLTGTPAFLNGKLFVPVSSLEIIPAADEEFECCTFRGSVLALDALTGNEIWRHYSIEQEASEVSLTSVGTRVFAPSGAPIWSSPTVDRKRNVIYVGTGENYSSPAEGNSDAVLAIDIDTGERVWTRQSTAGDAWNVACMMAENPNCPPEDGPDFDHGASILLVERDGQSLLLAGHKNGTVYGLDPDNKGAVLWQTEIGRGSIQGGVHFGMATDENQLYVPINDMNNTRNGDYLDPELARPGMHSIDALTGKLLWSHVQENVCHKDAEFCDPGISAAVTAIPGAVFAGHLDGFVRAYGSESGKLLWEFDTRPEIIGVNGEPGFGGSMSGAGPAIAIGHVVTNSGYGLYNHEAGNLLLVFSADN